MDILNFFSLKGVAKRKEWWGVTLCGGAINAGAKTLTADNGVLLIVSMLVMLLVTPVTVRRLRDAYAGVWIPAGFIALMAGVLLGGMVDCEPLVHGCSTVAYLVGLYIFLAAGFGKSK